MKIGKLDHPGLNSSASSQKEDKVDKVPKAEYHPLSVSNPGEQAETNESQKTAQPEIKMTEEEKEIPGYSTAKEIRFTLEEKIEEGKKTKTPGKEVTKPIKCLQCGAKYTSEDNAYFCAQHCRCHRCVIEGLCEGTGNACKLCHNPYQLETISLANRGHKRCHVCCIAVDIEEIEATAACRLCHKCVTLSDERTWLGLKKAKGVCRMHQGNIFDIDKDFYANLQAKKPFSKSACCQSATPSDTRLPCGHFVCAIHKEHLKFCRNCQSSVSQVTPDP